MVQNVNFSPVDKNSDLSLKLNSTCHHEYRVLLDFQNRAPDVKKLKFMQTEIIVLTSKMRCSMEAHFPILI